MKYRISKKTCGNIQQHVDAFERGKLKAFCVRQRLVKHFEEMHFGSLCWQFIPQRLPAHPNLSATIRHEARIQKT